LALIYVSSTYEDLKEYRERVSHGLRQLGHNVRAMEEYVASDTRPLDECLQDVAACDIYVLIVAWRYGYVPPKGNPKKLSITELEYRHAEAKPRLVFLLDEKQPWRPDFLEKGKGADKLTALRNELKKDHLASIFKSPDELAGLVTTAVTRQLEKQRSSNEPVKPASTLQDVISPEGWMPGRRGKTLPRVADVRSPFGAPVGVFASSIASRFEQQGQQAPYVARQIDSKLDDALNAGKWVLLVGAPRAGKTRSAWEGVRRTLTNYTVLFPNRLASTPIADLSSLASPLPVEGTKVVLWLDEAYRLLATGDASRSTFARLQDSYPDLIVVGTIESAELARLRSPAAASAAERGAAASFDAFSDVLASFTELRLFDHLTESEETAARRIYRDLVDEPGFIQGFGRFFAASEERWRQYLNAFDDRKSGAAAVTAAIDWRRTGMLRPIGRNDLAELLKTYLARLEPGQQTSEQLDKAVDWACDVSLLSRFVRNGSEANGFTAAGDIVQRFEEGGTPVSDAIPTRTWSFVLDRLQNNDGITVALAAFTAGKWDIAAQAAEHAVTTSETARGPASLLAASALLMNEGFSARMRSHLERVVKIGEEPMARDASLILASLLVDADEPQEAERIVAPYEHSDNENTRTSVRIIQAAIALNTGKLDRAEALMRAVLDSSLSQTNIMSAAGVLLLMTERFGAAQIDRLTRPLLDSPETLVLSIANAVLGSSAFMQGRLDEAQTRLDEARKKGPPFIVLRSTSVLGWLALITGRPDEAESLFNEVLRSTEPLSSSNASLGLGFLYLIRGERDAARERLQEAMRTGPRAIRRGATLQLAVLIAADGDAKAAADLIEPYANQPAAAPLVAQAAALSGDLARARQLLNKDQLVGMLVFEQLLFVQQAVIASDQPRNVEGAELMLEPFRHSPIPILEHLAKTGLAVCAVNRGTLDLAAELFRDVAEHAGGAIAQRSLINLAGIELQRGNTAEAERLVSPLVKERNVAARANFILARAALMRGDKAGGRKLLSLTAEIGVEDTDVSDQARLMLASFALADGNPEGAERLFKLVSQSKTPAVRATALNNLSLIYLQSNNLPQARQFVDDALKLVPEDTIALARKISIADAMGEQRIKLETVARLGELARAHVQRLLAEFPPGLEATIGAESMASFLEQARRDPESTIRGIQAEGELNRARLLQMDGRLAEAIAVLDRSLELSPDLIPLWQERAELRFEAGDKKGAVVDLTRAKDLDEKSPADLFIRAVQDLPTKPAAAARLFELHRLIDPDFAMGAFGLATAYASLGRVSDARAEYDRAVALAPANPDILAGRADLHSNLWEIPEALKDYETAAAADPGNAKRIAAVGATLGLLGRDEEAMARLNEALNMTPDDTSIRMQRGMQHRRAGRFTEAAADLDRCLESEPDSTDMLAIRADIAVAAGEHERAMTLLDRVIASGSGQKDWSYFLRGLAQHALGHAANAATNFADAIRELDRFAPTDPIAPFNRALYLMAVGSIEEAGKAYHERITAAAEPVLRAAIADLRLLEKWGPWNPQTGSAIVAEINSALGAAPR